MNRPEIGQVIWRSSSVTDNAVSSFTPRLLIVLQEDFDENTLMCKDSRGVIWWCSGSWVNDRPATEVEEALFRLGGKEENRDG
jgi:hypothetical protein